MHLLPYLKSERRRFPQISLIFTTMNEKRISNHDHSLLWSYAGTQIAILIQ